MMSIASGSCRVPLLFFLLLLWPLNSLVSRLVAALPAVVGLPATCTAERPSELFSQSLFMSVNCSMTVNLSFHQR